MDKLQPDGEARVLFSGKLFRVVLQPMRAGEKTFEFERVIRPPGTRIIVLKNDKILITKEFRSEFADYDYRLPGGKVFDSLEDYVASDATQILTQAEAAAKRECLEEAGLEPKSIRYLCSSKAGATVEWDLHFFVVEDFEMKNQQLEDGEHIEVNWYSLQEVKKLCLNGSIREDRTVGVLLRFLEEHLA